MLFFLFFRFESSNIGLKGDRNYLILVFLILLPEVSSQTSGLLVEKWMVTDSETHYANMCTFLNLKEVHFFFLQGSISCCCQTALLSSRKKSTCPSKTGPGKAKLSTLSVQFGCCIAPPTCSV